MTRINPRGKRVFVTGAASGIGYETCLAFARAGADIIATDIDLKALLELQSAVEALGRDCQTYGLNVCDEQAFCGLADELVEKGQLPHVVVNNAGVGYLGSFLEQTSAIWQRILDINVMGVVNGCRAFLPHLLAVGDARAIVNVASMASLAPLVNMSAYAASKYAVHGFSEVLTMELADTPVQVSCVHPGIINTAIVRSPGTTAPSISDQQLNNLQNYYCERGSLPTEVAADIVRGVMRGQASIFTGNMSRSTTWLKRLCSTSLFRKLLLDSARKIGYLAPNPSTH